MKTNTSKIINVVLAVIVVALLLMNKLDKKEENNQTGISSSVEMADTTFEKKSLGSYTMVYPMPVFIVGTYDKNNTPNMMAVAWGGIVSSVPRRVSIAVSPKRYTYDNLKLNECFTISIPSSKYLNEVDYVGNVSGRDENKFEATGLTPVEAEYVHAPYVKEFPLILECRVVNVDNFGSESHTQFIGEIIDVKADPDYLIGDDNPDINKIDPVVFSYGTQDYHRVGERIGRAGAEWQKVKGSE